MAWPPADLGLTAGVDATITALPGISSPARRAEASGLVAKATAMADIRRTVERFAHAYNLLDANAAQEVWPSVPVEQLSRAFNDLQSQSLTFDRCAINRLSVDAASVSCAGSTRIVPRIGHASPRVESRQWRFTLARADTAWLIETVDVSR
jgi:hypothetical protein